MNKFPQNRRQATKLLSLIIQSSLWFCALCLYGSLRYRSLLLYETANRNGVVNKFCELWKLFPVQGSHVILVESFFKQADNFNMITRLPFSPKIDASARLALQVLVITIYHIGSHFCQT